MQPPIVNAADHSHEHHVKEYAELNSAGELVRPTNYREWVFVGAPVTPKDMNDGKSAFPEFHNVSIDPASWAHYKKNQRIPERHDYSQRIGQRWRQEIGEWKWVLRGRIPWHRANGQDKKRFADKFNSWPYFGFNDKPSAAGQPDGRCAACHKANCC
jgi:hypothetical protein